MANDDIDEPLLLFRRQYLQCLDPDFLTWPAQSLLRQPDAQQWLFKHPSDRERLERQPPELYQLRVLKPLLAKIEAAIVDPDEDEISDDLMASLSSLITAAQPSESAAVQQRSFVTFACPAADGAARADDAASDITLLESRSIISGSQNTGHRTWEAALHLGSYLLSTGAALIVGKCILELGAGTGFLSILCATHLGARHVTATDGDEGVVDALHSNLFLNGLEGDGRVVASILRWGHGLRGTWVEDDCETWPYDVVLGADITYDKTAVSALIATLRILFDMRPKLVVLISNAIRNIETSETFRNACERNRFLLTEVNYTSTPAAQQKALFYSIAVPLKILRIVAAGNQH